MSKVTVVIATRNRARTLRQTLEHLTATGAPIIVVDNASTDDTVAVARSFPGVLAKPLPRNEGAVARNYGVAAARTPYVAFADDDSWWAPDALPRAAALFDAHPRLGLIAARTLVGPHRRLDPVAVAMAAAPLGQPDDLPGPSVLGFLACGAVVRRDAFLASGGFDPVVFFMGEEARLAYDLYASGWGLAYCDDMVAYHCPGPPSGDDGKVRLAARNRALTAWMRRPLGVAIRETARLDRPVRGEVVRRLPMALARRRRPHPTVEAALATLANAGGVVGTEPRVGQGA
jgi:glycosyltransferase involved in cell wall biosynthesis